jgi:hypothetical protein
MTDSSVRAEASRLLEKITPGEWSLHGAQGDFTVLGPDVQRIASLDARDRPESMQNAEFIVKAPRLLRALLAEGPELCLCGTHPAENACMKLASDGKLADGYRCRRELTRPDPETITRLQQLVEALPKFEALTRENVTSWPVEPVIACRLCHVTIERAGKPTQEHRADCPLRVLSDLLAGLGEKK